VAETADGRIAAYAVFWLDELNGHGHLEPVGTVPEMRRRGLARAVISHALVRMRAAGMTSVTLTHIAENVAARRLYESLGFVQTDLTYGFRRRC
jgi:ribosomal protein S18 acetylase RimI-like enzyme